jgi:hypothetical protein
MDLSITREYLAEAERHIALSNRHIARQVEIIEELGRSGCPIDLALDVLETYREVHAAHIAHRDRIRKELEQ